jgi:MoaA/NifB/PqqE/SkfB family radical SAM enzyme
MRRQSTLTSPSVRHTGGFSARNDRQQCKKMDHRSGTTVTADAGHAADSGKRKGDRVYLPDVQLRANYQALSDPDPKTSIHNRFQRRLESANLNPSYFESVKSDLEQALRRDPTDSRLRLELALILLQLMPNDESLTAARTILDAADRSSSGGQYDRIHELITMMSENSKTNSTSYVVERVNWSISNACPMICKGCYNPFVAQTLELDEAIKVLANLKAHGTKAIMFTGGDPLLWEGIDELLARAKALEFTVGLDTTGHVASPDRLADLARHVDTFGVPLDGASEESIRRFRRGPSTSILEKITANLDILSSLGAHVRVHTVVHRENIQELPQILDMLQRFPSVTQWALYQYWGRRASERINRSMDIETTDFNFAAASLQETPVEILPYAAKRREMTNFIIQASGQVTTSGSQPGEEFLIGNLLQRTVSEILMSPAVSQRSLITRLIGHGYADTDAK